MEQEQIIRYEQDNVNVRILIEHKGSEEDIDNIEEFITQIKVKIEYIIKASNYLKLPLESVVYEESNILATIKPKEVSFKELEMLRKVGLVGINAINDPTDVFGLGNISLIFAGRYNIKNSDDIVKDDCEVERELDYNINYGKSRSF